MTDDIISVFWTSGFDSTYRLVDLLLAGFTVEPIYISAPIDTRKSQAFELRHMQKIRTLIAERYPEYANKLLPTLDVDSVSIPQEYQTAIKTIGFSGRFRANEWAVREGFAQRPGQRMQLGRQYAFLAIIALTHPRPIELPIEYGGRESRLLGDKTVGECHDRRINPVLFDTDEGWPLAILKDLRFPLLHTSKQEMYRDAKARGFMEILDQTWTCWRPVEETESPCGECPACRERDRELS